MKMNTRIAIVVILPFLYSNVFAWNDTLTHKHITRVAIDGSSLNPYLQNQLKIKDGKTAILNGMPLEEWLQYGAEMEDDPACRASNHFHNPYLPWGAAGLADTWWLVDIYCWGLGMGQYPPGEIKSNLTWATGHLDQQDLNYDVMAFNQWDWQSARQYFYTYLTGLDLYGNSVASNEAQHDEYLTKTLRALGQVMHLLQDMSVPAHVRDDFSQGHTMVSPGPEVPWKWIGNGFEKYVWRKDRGNWFNLTPVKQNLDDMQITDLWDTDQLTESVVPTGSAGLGLAEYTSMNFLSEYRMFNSSSCFPFPSYAHCIVEASDPPLETKTPLERQYLASINGHPGERIHHLAIVSYLENFVEDNYLPNVSTEKIPLWMDDNCYNEYAEKLIPRAIGYSSQLLDYFFRGELDIKKAYFTYGDDLSLSGMDLEFKNISPSLISGQEVEPLAGGQIDLVYRYLPPGEKTNAVAQGRDPIFSYGLVQNIYTVLDETDPINSEYVVAQQEIIFNPPIPAGSEEIYFNLVYHGVLGNEQGAVFASGQKRTGSRIAYHLFAGQWENPAYIEAVLANGGQTLSVTEGLGVNPYYYNPSWSPGGLKMALQKDTCPKFDNGFCWGMESDIVIVDLTSDDAFPQNVMKTFHLAEDYLPMHSASFSPEGDRFVTILGDLATFSGLGVFDIASGDWEYVGGDFEFWLFNHRSLKGSAPAWNPQDDTIAFHGLTGDNKTGTGWDGPLGFSGAVIYVIEARGEGAIETQITSEGYLDTQPAWSPDGQWLAFVSNRDFVDRLDLWIMDRKGNHMQKIYAGDANCFSPSFSPDGLSIAFSMGTGLFTIDIWGNNLTNLNRPNATAPEWSPALPLPSAAISADATTINTGQSATLTWTCGQAKSANIDNGIGDVEFSGSDVVTPADTTTYTLTVTGLGGTVTDSVTVTVNQN